LSSSDPHNTDPRARSTLAHHRWLVAIAAASAVVLVWLSAPSAAARDGAELTAAGASLGVAHPTGFSLDVLLWRLAMMVPVGDLAFRANATAALFGALSCATLAHLAFTWLSTANPAREREARALASVAPFALLCSQTTLRAFTAVEVYASSLFVSLALIAAVSSARAKTAARALALCAGLSFATHTTVRIAVIASAIALLVGHRSSRSALSSARLARSELSSARLARSVLSWAALSVMAASLVLYLPVAARKLPWVDWGGPIDARGLWTHLSAARIREAFSSQMGGHASGALTDALSVLRADLGLAALLLALVGAILALRDKSPLSLSIALSALGDLAYSTLVNPMGTRDRQTLFLTEAALVLLALRALFALAPRAVQEPRAQRWIVALSGALFALSLAARLDLSYSGAREGWTAVEVYGGPGAIGAAPPRAVILCESDELCGGSLYARVCEGERPDVVVLPRQHLWDRTVWRRLSVALGHPPPERSQPRSFDEALRVRRMLGVLSVFGPRVRWEQGDRTDERLARIAVSPSESPALATPIASSPLAPPNDETVDGVSRWLAQRESPGVLSRRIAATILFSAGMRAARDPSSLDRAALFWQRAIERDPTHASSLSNLAVARAQRGRLREAIALCDRALEADPTRAVAWQNLLRFCREIGDTACVDRALRGARAHNVNADLSPSVHSGAARP
jgi:hypothetical protein